jgi:hypothetical protein
LRDDEAPADAALLPDAALSAAVAATRNGAAALVTPPRAVTPAAPTPLNSRRRPASAVPCTGFVMGPAAARLCPAAPPAAEENAACGGSVRAVRPAASGAAPPPGHPRWSGAARCATRGGAAGAASESGLAPLPCSGRRPCCCCCCCSKNSMYLASSELRPPCFAPTCCTVHDHGRSSIHCPPIN